MPEAFNTQTSSSLFSLYVSKLTLGNKYSRFLLSKMSTELSSPLGELLENVTENVRKEGECYGASDDVGVDVIGLVAIIVFYAAVLAVGTN